MLFLFFVCHLQKKNGQAGEDEHEEVGKEEGAATVLETQKGKPPDIS